MSSDEALLKETESSPPSERSGDNSARQTKSEAEPETRSEPAAVDAPPPPEPSLPEPETPEPPRRRLRLNPIIADESQARPRPSLGFPEAASPPAEEAGPAADVRLATPPPAAEAATDVSGAPPRSDAPPSSESVETPPAEPAPPAEAKTFEVTAGEPAAEPVPAPPADAPESASRAAASVEIPPVDELGADLEAQIAAAMSGEALTEAEQPPAEAGEAAVPRPSEEDLEPGMRLKGQIQTVGSENVFLELGYRSPGVVPLRQFASDKPDAQPEVGRELEVVVDRVDLGEGLIHLNLPRGKRKVSGNWDAVAAGQVVDCMVTKTNKGGLEITVGSLRGFLPASQVDLGFVSDLEPFVGQKLTVQIVEANPRKRNLVVSRRAVLMVERKEAEENLWKSLELGQSFAGRVKTIKDYGAFVDIGGVDGFLHVSEVSWNRIRHPSDVLQEGQQVEVQVIGLDPDKKKISLGMKQLTTDPWSLVAEKYPAGATVSGKVTRTTEFGAFVELEEGVEGLVHISELDHRRVKRVTEVLKVGQEVEAKVLETVPDRKRISLSLKALKEAPQDEKKSDEDLAPGAGQAFERKRKEPLKGGTTGGAGRGLFGDPKDFS